MNRAGGDASELDDDDRRALLEADDRAERRMPLKGLAAALVVIVVGWARARWWT